MGVIDARGKAVKGLTYLILAIGTVIILAPIYFVLVMSSYTNEALHHTVPYWFSDQFWINTSELIERAHFFRVYSNSLIVSTFAVMGAVFFAALYGYGVSKYNFKGKKALTWIVIILMMIPQQVNLVGYVMQMRTMGFTGTLAPMIFVWLAHPFSAFFMIQFIKGAVPTEVIESGRIDGANELKILFSIAMPFLLPAFAAVGTLVFLWSWNNYLLPLVVANTMRLRTLPVFIQNLAGEYREELHLRATAVIWTIIPLVTVFSVFSKTFIKGIAAGAIKG